MPGIQKRIKQHLALKELAGEGKEVQRQQSGFLWTRLWALGLQGEGLSSWANQGLKRKTIENPLLLKKNVTIDNRIRSDLPNK